MNRGWIGGVAVVALSLASTASAQDSSNLPGPERYAVRLQYQEFRPTLSGTTQKGGAASSDGTVLGLADDLGLADSRTFDAQGAIQFKKGWKLRGLYMPVGYDGDVESSTSYNYGDMRVVRFDRVVSSVKGNYFGADIEYDFVKGSHGFLGAVGGARLIDVDSSVVDVSLNSRELDTVTETMPYIGITGRGYMGHISVEGEIGGLSIGGSGSTMEASGSLRFHISDHIAASGGYRYLKVKTQADRLQLDMKASGWIYGLELSL